jgi:hypothetical protein
MREYLAKTAPWYASPTALTIYDVSGSRSVTPGH